MEYKISKQETNRRIKAFTSLSISLPASLALTGILFWRNNLSLIDIITLAIILVFIIFWIFIVKFFDHFRNTEIRLTDHHLERITPGLHEKIALSDISRITTVKTTRNAIREVRIYWDKNITVLDGLDNFNQFVDELIRKCSRKIEKSTINEPIDYDHPLFYIILGLILGVLSLFFIRTISALDYTELHTLYYIISGYSLVMGLYFIFGRPLSKRYGNKTYVTDMVWGVLLASAGIIVYLFI